MKKWLLILSTHVTLLCTAQNNPSKALYFNHLFVEDGLPSGHVFSITQDKEGYMWLGTTDGLVRFDGYASKRYSFVSKKNESGSFIVSLCEDSNGELWVSDAYSGLYHYNRGEDTFTGYKHDPSNANSLADGELKNIMADTQGNIWIILTDRKSNDALVIDRLNTRTHQFKHYGIRRKGSYYRNDTDMSPLYRDGNDNIWLGTENGIQKFDRKSDRFVSYFTSNDSASKKTFDAIVAYPYNTIWTSVQNSATGKYEGLWRWNRSTNSVTVFRHRDNDVTSLANDTVFNIQIDSKNQLWITTAKGLSLFHAATENFTSFTPGSDNLNSYINAVHEFKEDKQGNFWFASRNDANFLDIESHGLFNFNTKTKQFTNYVTDPKQPDGLSNNYLFNIFTDQTGDVWFTAGSAGVQWINNKQSKFTSHTIQPDKKSGSLFGTLSSAAEAPDHSIWLATTEGLYHWFPISDSIELVNFHIQPLKQIINDVAVDKRGLVWFCGDGGSTLTGLYCLNPSTHKIKNYRHKKVDITSLSSNFINDILVDHSGDLWLGTWGGGLCKLNINTGNFIRYPYVSNADATNPNHKLDDDVVMSVCEDKENSIWVGTRRSSLSRLNSTTGTFTSYQYRQPDFRFVTSITEDSEQRLWATSYHGAGVLLYDIKRDTIKKFTEKDGLLFNIAGSVLEDGAGNIWLKSVRGISIINPKSHAILNFTEDVLKEREHIFNHSFKTSSSLFIFPGKYGFVSLNPNDFAPDSITPTVHIESVSFTNPDKTKNQTEDSAIIRYGKTKVNLNYNENRLTFHYVGLLYQNTSQIQYKYKLDGYDKNWILAGTQRAVTYTNLAPDTYTFHVTAANSDAIWSQKDDAITIVIAPPFWKTWWFAIIVLSALAPALFLAVKYYLNRRLKAQQQEFDKLKEIEIVRSKISMDIHDEISSGLTKISLLSQRVKTRYEKSKDVEPEWIDKIAGSSREVISNLSEIIWAVDPKHDNLQSLLSYIRNYTSNFFESTAIESDFTFPDEIPLVAVSPDIKHNLFLVIKEALNNIAKHAGATKTSLYFRHTSERYALTITDNGKGIDNLNGRPFGNGFTNMKKRMEAISGSISISSECGKGTKIQLKGRFGVKTKV